MNRFFRSKQTFKILIFGLLCALVTSRLSFIDSALAQSEQLGPSSSAQSETTNNPPADHSSSAQGETTDNLSADSSPPLYFLAINAGYKDDSSSQNYDFITLAKNALDDLSLADIRIVYTNSNGNAAGTITFPDRAILHSKTVTLGFSGSPQYSDYKSTPYAYTLSSSGIASTAGMLQLYLGDSLLDEVCWGKISCQNQNQKFATSATDNRTLSRCIMDDASAPIAESCLSTSSFTPSEVYHEIASDAIIILEEEETTAQASRCDGLQFSEIFTYYQNSPAEQFIEFFNPTNDTISLDGCQLKYKNKLYPLSGELVSGAYLAIYDVGVTFTKNPTSSLKLYLTESDTTIVDELTYYHGQKSNTSFALFYAPDGAEFWQQTYLLTPNAENILQEFQTCPEGKIINQETGNCIKSQESTSETKICPEGKYLNPLTGRCKNIVTTTTTSSCKAGYYRSLLTNRCRKIATAAETAACKTGYERNPETNRCRKIRSNTGADYPIQPINQASHSSGKTFAALFAIIGLLGLGLVFTLIQFRQEIRLLFSKLSKKLSVFLKFFRKPKMIQ